MGVGLLLRSHCKWHFLAAPFESMKGKLFCHLGMMCQSLVGGVLLGGDSCIVCALSAPCSRAETENEDFYLKKFSFVAHQSGFPSGIESLGKEGKERENYNQR